MKHQVLSCRIVLFMIAFIASAAIINVQAQDPVQPIVGYDGINFGSTLEQVKSQLASLQGISRMPSGEPLFERVPTKPYYRYYAQRSKTRGQLTSEVIVYFKNGKVIQFKDVFGGTLVGNSESATKAFKGKAKEFTKVWGVPTLKKKLLVRWVRDDGYAVLSLELPANPYALPILKLVVAAR